MIGFAKTHRIAFASYALLGLADLVLTVYLIRTSDGRIYESNPIAGAWLSSYGWTGLALFKALTMTLVVFCAAVVSCRRPAAGTSLLRFSCVATAVVVLYSVVLVRHLNEESTARSQSVRLFVNPP